MTRRLPAALSLALAVPALGTGNRALPPAAGRSTPSQPPPALSGFQAASVEALPGAALPRVLPPSPVVPALPSPLAAPVELVPIPSMAPKSIAPVERALSSRPRPFEGLAAAAEASKGGLAPEATAEQGTASLGGAFDASGSRPKTGVHVPEAAPADPDGTGTPPPLTRARFEELVSAIDAFSPLLPNGRDTRKPTAAARAASEANLRDLQALVDAALRRKDVDLLARLALLTSPSRDPQTRNLFANALYQLELSNLLSYGKPGDYQVGLDARKARATVERHAWVPLEPETRAWILSQLREGYLRGYLSRGS